MGLASEVLLTVKTGYASGTEMKYLNVQPDLQRSYHIPFPLKSMGFCMHEDQNVKSLTRDIASLRVLKILVIIDCALNSANS